ncbi:phosphate-starvation-inducible PsiE family protein [Motiliproteus sediminis]|uniref:phosphate-starvation-inducible PsiE family protein n=1 Tax=Motiliproteus sediminis TaxID=1468178 RepID=UPI001AEF938A|nr:phosphate-starvation-inducible PsiE family protein [Motiliproteus sediminis]
MSHFLKPLQRWFDRFVDAVFGLILLFITLGIAIGAFMLLRDLWDLMSLKGITGHYIDLISDVLTLYVLVELSRSLVEYFHTRKLRLTFIIDAALVFVVREVLIGLFKHDLKPEMILALSALILVLGVVRIGSALVYQKGEPKAAHRFSRKEVE